MAAYKTTFAGKSKCNFSNVKFHMLLHLTDVIRAFCSLDTAFGGYGEHFHIFFKEASVNTQQRKENFEENLLHRVLLVERLEALVFSFDLRPGKFRYPQTQLTKNRVLTTGNAFNSNQSVLATCYYMLKALQHGG
jgi:hypothetical protein